jgi:hypothetical protein
MSITNILCKAIGYIKCLWHEHILGHGKYYVQETSGILTGLMCGKCFRKNNIYFWRANGSYYRKKV